MVNQPPAATRDLHGVAKSAASSLCANDKANDEALGRGENEFEAGVAVKAVQPNIEPRQVEDKPEKEKEPDTGADKTEFAVVDKRPQEEEIGDVKQAKEDEEQIYIDLKKLLVDNQGRFSFSLLPPSPLHHLSSLKLFFRRSRRRDREFSKSFLPDIYRTVRG